MMYKDTTGATFARRVENGISSWEQIFIDGWGDGISPQHRTMQVRLANANVQWWRDGQWTLFATTDSADNATFLSRRGKSHDGDTTVTVVKRRVTQFREEFDVYLNTLSGSTKLKTIVGPPVNNPTGTPPTRCTVWDLSGSEWTDCYQEQRNQPDFRTTSYTVAYSSARHEVLLSVTRDSSAWKVELPPFVYDGYYQRNYSYDTFALDSWLYAIPIGDTTAVRTAQTPGFRLSNVGYSDDGVYLAMRSATFSYLNRFTPDTTYSSRNSTCKALFSQVFTTGLVHVDGTPTIVNGTLTCFPDAVYAP
jgi:hypothetical protein